MAIPMWKWAMRAAIVPAIVGGYVVVAGTTGFCPTCTVVMDQVWGKAEPITPGAPRGSVVGLNVYNMDGASVPLASFVGKPLIIDVWATWCPPCRSQREVMHSMDAAFLDSVNIVALSTDNDPRALESFLKAHPSRSTDLVATPEALQAFGGVSAIPTLVFVDASGQIRDVETGLQSARDLKRRVAGLQSPGSLAAK